MDYRDQVYFEFEPESELAFPEAEYRARLERIRARMADAKIDCLFLTSPESLYYVSGFICMWYQTEGPKEWPSSNGIALHVDHDRFIHFETEREAVLTRTFTVAHEPRFFPRSTYRDGTKFIAEELKAEGWLGGNVGLELWARRPNRAVGARFQAAFEEAGARVVDGSDILREVRWVKSPAEMSCLEEAARIARVGLAAAQRIIRPGLTELEVQGEVVRALTAAGGELPAMMMPVLAGGKSNSPHAVSTRRKLRAGEVVLLDLCGVHKRYHVNAARTFALGEPDRDVRATADKAAGVMDVVRACLRPNLPVGELNEAVKRYYEEAGLWESRGWIGGYEMGIAFPPDWVGNFVYDPLSAKNADRSFEPGTAVNHESQVFLPRHRGQYFMIESFLFGRDRAALATPDVPYPLIVLE
jgi:Xaa-Pro aminopeptidase